MLSGAADAERQPRIDLVAVGADPPLATFSSAAGEFLEAEAADGAAGRTTAAISWFLSRVPRGRRFSRAAREAGEAAGAGDPGAAAEPVARCQAAKLADRAQVWDDKQVIERVSFSPWCGLVFRVSAAPSGGGGGGGWGG